MKSYIMLDNVIFYAHHGVFEQERQVGNTFVVNLKLEVDLVKSGETDELEDTVSYAEVYELIEREMALPSKLLEHVATRIIKAIRMKFALVGQIELKLSKKNPPVGGDVESASVLIID